jgi:hypothetical protein
MGLRCGPTNANVPRPRVWPSRVAKEIHQVDIPANRRRPAEARSRDGVVGWRQWPTAALSGSGKRRRTSSHHHGS